MKYEKEVNEILGTENVKLIKNAIRNTRITIDDLQFIAGKMGGTISGTFDRYRRENKPYVHIFMFMLDTWYNDILCKGTIDGYKKMKEILEDEDIELGAAIARELKPLKPETLRIGLPATHYEIPGLRSQDKTGAMAFPSNQGQTLTCASHAVGRAILEILDSVGWDADQQSIIDALIVKYQPRGQPENPDIFNNEEIKVKVTKKEPPKEST